MKSKKLLLLFCTFIFLGVFFYCLPFLFIRLKKLDFPYTVLYSIAKQKTKSTRNSEEQIIQLYDFIRNTIKVSTTTTTKNLLLGESGKHLVSKQGYCDEQCNTLLTLVNTINHKGRLIFLYGKDSISHHSVCEVEIDGHYCMFDPFYGVTIRNHRGKLLGVHEIIKNSNLVRSLPFNSSISTIKYQALYAKKFPYKITKYNQIIQLPTEQKIHGIYKIWYAIFGEINRKHLFNYYYKINQISKQDQLVVNQLFD